LGIVTKSALVVRDLNLLKEVAQNNRLTVHITVTTMNARLARQLEPRAPRPDLRMRTVAELREAGLRAGVMCSPLMPGITDSAMFPAHVSRICARTFSRAIDRIRAALRVERVCLVRIP
jgi:DNA repair photolyase